MNPVDRKEPNHWGLYDMHGNVFEWCNDLYDIDYYAKSPSNNPTGPKTGKTRVIRGGSYADSAVASRSSRRGNYDPIAKLFVIGFRVVRRP